VNHTSLAKASLLVAGLVLSASSALFCVAADSSAAPLYDTVAVGWGKERVQFATLAKPAGRLEWRYRSIPLSPPANDVSAVELSLGGTKALVVPAQGAPRVLDLTRRIAGIDVAQAMAFQHRLPHQLFPYAADGKICLLDDLGRSGDRPCRDAAAAAIHEDGRILYAHRDGHLALVLPDGGEEQLPYRIPPHTSVQLLAGLRGDLRDFLVLATGPDTNQNGPVPGMATKVIDPRRPDAPLAQFTDLAVAALWAMQEFTHSGGSMVEGGALEALAAQLKKGSPDLTWSFYRVRADNQLYAPVLEFAAGEPSYPSDVDIWQEIEPLAHGSSKQDYQAAYASLGGRRWSRCTYYVRTLSYPGTWLVEYWFYYPFDEGKSHPHLHDSEHLFVEVDKLGGTVRNILASDHDSFVANNIYSTLVKDASPVALPLFATVELGKHAMAPDLDHAGRFERGVDDNVHRESYSVWGLRDRSGYMHFLMEPYLASMSLPRDRDGRFAPKEDDSIFPGLSVPADHLVCGLQPFPDVPRCPHCEGATSAAGVEHLEKHPDAVTPEAIYKPYVNPWRELRLGMGIFDWSEVRGELSLGLVSDFRHLTGGLLPIASQAILELGWKPLGATIPIPLAGESRFVYSKSTLYAGAGVQRLLTNTQGFYFEATPKWVDISERFVNGTLAPSDPHWQYGGVSYHTGYILELPGARKGTLVNSIGVVIRSAPAYPILFEWRVGLAFLRRRGRHDFGARVADRNPYE
jgi:hypothetical protein